jgi:hypothetical protein
MQVIGDPLCAGVSMFPNTSCLREVYARRGSECKLLVISTEPARCATGQTLVTQPLARRLLAGRNAQKNRVEDLAIRNVVVFAVVRRATLRSE